MLLIQNGINFIIHKNENIDEKKISQLDNFDFGIRKYFFNLMLFMSMEKVKYSNFDVQVHHEKPRTTLYCYGRFTSMGHCTGMLYTIKIMVIIHQFYSFGI